MSWMPDLGYEDAGGECSVPAEGNPESRQERLDLEIQIVPEGTDLGE
jgi:hypothetical protein